VHVGKWCGKLKAREVTWVRKVENGGRIVTSTSTNTPSMTIHSHLAWLSLFATWAQNWTKPNHATMAPWWSYGAPTMEHIALQNWMVWCPNYAMQHFDLFLIMLTHLPLYQSHVS